MKNIFPVILFSILFVTGCAPDPLMIDIDQIPAQMAVTSASPEPNTVIVAVTYSLTSLTNLTEPDADSTAPLIPEGILADSAFVTISDGVNTYPLIKVLPGIYLNTGIPFESGKEYSLFVKDNINGNTIVAKTTYQPAFIPDLILPVVKRETTDTTIQLRMTVTDDRPEMNYYVVAYDNVNPATVPSPIGSPNFAIANLEAIKKVEVFSDAEAVNGVITKTFDVTNIDAKDRLFVHYGRIDKGYFDYLSSYKRSGSLVTQIASEPLTLPTNIVTGLGYFALYDAQRIFFDLKNY